jgi:hypothetical protein
MENGNENEDNEENKRMKSDPPYTPPNHSLLDHQSPTDNYPFFLPLLPFPAPLLAYHIHLLAFLLPLVLLLLCQLICLPVTYHDTITLVILG